MPASHILITDDSRTIRTQVEQILTQAGYQVTSARDGREALQQAQDNPPALMVLDVNMPLLDGFGVCLELRKLGLPWSGIPVVLLTCSQSQALEVLGNEVGAYLHKPVQAPALLQAVRSFFPLPAEVSLPS